MSRRASGGAREGEITISVENFQSSVFGVINYLKQNQDKAVDTSAQLGVALDMLEVKVDSVSDDRGLFGTDQTVQAEPLSIRTRV